MGTYFKRSVVIAVAAATVVAPVSVGLLNAASQGLARPKCGGRVATIVGNSRANETHGTSGADVIVGLGGHDDIEGRGGNDVCRRGDGERLTPQPARG